MALSGPGIKRICGRPTEPRVGSTGEFAYVTITETKRLRPGLGRYYDEFAPAVARFGLALPERLLTQPTHLDPDFEHLTYGDRGQRGQSISKLHSGDVLAFFAALRPGENPEAALVYALIGLYVVDELVAARSVPASRWHENAHTRRQPGADDIVVRGIPRWEDRPVHD